MSLLILLLGIAVLAYALLGRWQQRGRTGLGVGGGRIVAADDSALN